jgi:hypothetical protein
MPTVPSEPFQDVPLSLASPPLCVGSLARCWLFLTSVSVSAVLFPSLSVNLISRRQASLCHVHRDASTVFGVVYLRDFGKHGYIDFGTLEKQVWYTTNKTTMVKGKYSTL